MLISQALKFGRDYLNDKANDVSQGQDHLNNFELDSELLLALVLDKDRTYLRTWPENEIDQALEKKFLSLLEERSQGKPIAYFLGEREFWSLPFKVNDSVLIPRPETECLVEYVLEQYSDQDNMKVLDLGTGSGAIAIALAKEKSDWKICASDKSEQALDIAKLNQAKLGVKNISFFQSDWFAQLPKQTYQLIISNPPYVAEDAPEMRSEIRFEPKSALVSAKDGIADIEKICASAATFLDRNAKLMLEHGKEQGKQVRQILQTRGFQNIETKQDYSGLDRFTIGDWLG